MPTPVKWKDAFQVNIGDAATGVQTEPRIIGLSDGRILVAWIESESGVIGFGAGTNIAGKIFSATGDQLSVLQMNTLSVDLDEGDFDIAPTSDGGFVIAYVDKNAGNQSGVVWERFGSAGTVEDTHRIATENVAGESFANPQVTVNQLTDSSMVTFTRNAGGDIDIRGVRINAAGTAGTEFDAAQNSSGFDGDGDIAILASGDYVSVYREEDSETSAEARIFTSGGTEIATFNLTNLATGSVPLEVASLANGNWVAVWKTAVGIGTGGDLKAQIFSPTGTPVTGQLPVVEGLEFFAAPQVVALPDGGFVIAWEKSAIEARRFNADGSPDGALFQVAASGTTPDVGVTGDGRILFSWNDLAGEIFASIWDPRDAAIDAADYQMHARNFLDTLVVTGGVTGTTVNGSGIDGAVLIGRGGGDVLDGGANAQQLRGGAGNDFYYVDNGADQVLEAAGEGNDRVFASVSYTLAAGASVEMFTTSSNTGTTAINLTGNELANVIYGNDGANSLDGRAGVDTLVGRLGDDFYYVDNAGDRVLENAGQGNDRVFASATYALAAGVSAELLATGSDTGTTAINLTGNELANTVRGNDGANTLNGGGGVDMLVGRLGNDFYYVDNGADQIVETAGEGTDRLFASISYTLAAGVSVETLTTTANTGTGAINLTGNALANVIYGNAGANTLNGGGGADTLIGWAGDDWFYVDNAGDRVTEAAGEGADRVFTSISYTLAAAASVETFTTSSNTGTTAINLTGNELGNIIYGNDGANSLDGKAGGDTLIGRAGGDAFAFTTALGAANVDSILDFAGGADRIALDDAIFAGIGTPGAFNAGAFVAGAAAQDASDRIVYNAAGQLFYDADGNGAGAAVLFATLQGVPSLTASDFLVI